MKRKDWADKQALKWMRIAFIRELETEDIAGALRAAEKRGYMRAVKLLRETAEVRNSAWNDAADWLEQKR